MQKWKRLVLVLAAVATVSLAATTARADHRHRGPGHHGHRQHHGYHHIHRGYDWHYRQHYRPYCPPTGYYTYPSVRYRSYGVYPYSGGYLGYRGPNLSFGFSF